MEGLTVIGEKRAAPAGTAVEKILQLGDAASVRSPLLHFRDGVIQFGNRARGPWWSFKPEVSSPLSLMQSCKEDERTEKGPSPFATFAPRDSRACCPGAGAREARWARRPSDRALAGKKKDPVLGIRRVRS